ncbi:MAG: nuclear transport factor 2 family protein [Actinomycetota bacterium]|nr:nuclear transport factor 2 family protein [Actinomycetota bacterium]
MRRLPVVAAVVLACGVLWASPASGQTDAVAVARALIDAENRHDVQAAVDLFAPGAIVNLPTGALVTRGEIEQWQRDLAAGNFRAEITPPVAVTPEVVTFSGTVALDAFRRLGISPLEANWQLTVQLGRITTFNFSFTPAAAARLQAALAGGGTGGGGAGSGAAQSGGGAAQGGGGSASAGGGQASAGTAGAGRSLALTGTGLDAAMVGVVAVALGALLLLSDRGWARPARGRRGRPPTPRARA